VDFEIENKDMFLMFLTNIKDFTISKLLEIGINYKLKGIGKMLNLNIDSKSKKINLEVMLKGEKESLKITINSFEVLEENGKFFITFENIDTSREWINVVSENFLKNRKFEVNGKIAKMLNVLI